MTDDLWFGIGASTIERSLAVDHMRFAVRDRKGDMLIACAMDIDAARSFPGPLLYLEQRAVVRVAAALICACSLS